MLVEHGMMGREYAQVLSNTVAAFALGDYEWLLALEADELHDIVDLMRHLRALRRQTPCARGDPVLHRAPGRRRRGRRGAAVTAPCRSAPRRARCDPDGRGADGYDAVLLAGFGGPEGPDDVMPFLRNVTRGRGIPEERLVEVAHHYQALGGVSPINEQNRALRAALRGGAGPPRHRRCRCCWGNRNWAPYLRRRRGRGARATVSAGCSASPPRRTRPTPRAGSTARTSGSRCADTGLVGSVRIDKVRPYFDRPGFRQPFVDGTVDALPTPRPGRTRRRRPGGRLHHPLHPADDGGHLRVRPTSATTGPGAPTSRQHLAVARAGGHRAAAAQRDDELSGSRHVRGSWPTSPAPGRRRCRGWSRTSTTSSPIWRRRAGAG